MIAASCCHAHWGNDNDCIMTLPHSSAQVFPYLVHNHCPSLSFVDLAPRRPYALNSFLDRHEEASANNDIRERSHFLTFPAKARLRSRPALASSFLDSDHDLATGTSTSAYSRSMLTEGIPSDHSNWYTSFAVNLTSPDAKHGGVLPTKCYGATTIGGKNEAPTLHMLLDKKDFADADVEGDPGSVVLVARDADAPLHRGPDNRIYPSAPLWVVANAPFNAQVATEIDGTTGTQVIPYQGPVLKDEYVHRIFFSVMALKYKVPDAFLHSWEGPFGLEHYLQRHRAFEDPTKRADYLMTAVQHFDKASQRPKKKPKGAGSSWFKFW
mmetsp:Transcript_51665/g.109776  ORF Transcript_51665/g.109776 Transcript_51665/m.109776 type:complete len:325 (-) Transcript_51665:204-1178(-)